MALITNQRNTVRNAFITLANSDIGWRDGGAITSAEFADRWLAVLDEYRSGVRPRGHYTLRVQPWIAARLSLSATLRTAITNHCQGN